MLALLCAGTADHDGDSLPDALYWHGNSIFDFAPHLYLK